MNKKAFSKEVYSLQAIHAAADAFTQICCIHITEVDTEILCFFEMVSPHSLTETMCEFENYLIDLIVCGDLYAES